MAGQWDDLGAPPGHTLQPTPVAPLADQAPYVVAWGDNGHLWSSRRDGKAWHWDDLGAAPHGQTLNLGTLATASYQNNPLAFTFGSNGHLWVDWLDGHAWKWQDQGAPAGRTLYPATIATTAYQSNPMAFVWDTTGGLWVNWWDGQARKWKWQSQGAPPAAPGPDGIPLGIATASYKNNPMAFVWDSAGHLWVNWWDGQARKWKWRDQGAPPVQTVAPGLDHFPSAIAATSYQGRPYVFAFGRDLHLWANWWDGSAWRWTDHGTPPGPDFLYVGGLAAASGPGGPMAFTKTEDRQRTEGHLWVSSWDGTGKWAEQDTPPGTHFPLNFIAAASYQSQPYVFVWDDDSGGDPDPHLWVNWSQ
jgi:hypothetical protein